MSPTAAGKGKDPTTLRHRDSDDHLFVVDEISSLHARASPQGRRSSPSSQIAYADDSDTDGSAFNTVATTTAPILVVSAPKRMTSSDRLKQKALRTFSLPEKGTKSTKASLKPPNSTTTTDDDSDSEDSDSADSELDIEDDPDIGGRRRRRRRQRNRDGDEEEGGGGVRRRTTSGGFSKSLNLNLAKSFDLQATIR
ncbi:hypothetical protein HDU67_005587, partial [Dinochytrium kinnereticum]